MIEKLIKESRVWKKIEALVDTLTDEMFAFSVSVRGLNYDVYHVRHPNRGTPLSIAFRIRQEDGKAEVTTIADGSLSAREMEPKIAEAQKKELS